MTDELPSASQESVSSAVSEVSTVTNSPTVEAVARHFPSRPTHRRGPSFDTSPQKPIAHASVPRPRSTIFAGSAIRGRLSIPSGEERPGKFDREFVEIDELGRGEFGRVIKARYKESNDVIFAVKKSKRFEGVKHR
jgi:mitosis inhibitor protein kinase SWE1